MPEKEPFSYYKYLEKIESKRKWGKRRLIIGAIVLGAAGFSSLAIPQIRQMAVDAVNQMPPPIRKTVLDEDAIDLKACYDLHERFKIGQEIDRAVVTTGGYIDLGENDTVNIRAEKNQFSEIIVKWTVGKEIYGGKIEKGSYVLGARYIDCDTVGGEKKQVLLESNKWLKFGFEIDREERTGYISAIYIDLPLQEVLK